MFLFSGVGNVMRPQLKIIKIQQEYFELLENLLAKERATLASSGKDRTEFVAELLKDSASQPTIVHEGRETSILFYKVHMLVEALCNFWSKNTESIREALSQSLTFKLQVSPRSNSPVPKAMGLYADTLIIPDLVLLEKVTLADPAFAIPNSSADLHVAVTLQLLLGLLAHKPLFLSDCDPLIAVIYPRSTGLDQYTENRVRTDFKEYTSTLFEKDFASWEDAWAFIAKLETHDDFNKAIKRQDILPISATSQSKGLSILEAFVEEVLLTRQMRGVDTSDAKINLGDHVAPFLWVNFRELTRISDLCFELDANTEIPSQFWNPFKWKLEFDSRSTATFTGSQAHSEALQVSCFEHENLRWLANVPTEALIRLRQQGELEDLRRVFRVGRQSLKTSSLDDFARISAQVRGKIEEALSDHQAQISEANREKWKKLGVNLAGCCASIAFGVASALFPPLAPYAVTPTVLFGKSFYDVVNDHVQGRRKIAELRDRPIGILADIFASGSHAYPEQAKLDIGRHLDSAHS